MSYFTPSSKHPSVSGLFDLQGTHYARIASNAMFLYDHLITVNDEVELIWKAKWSFVTILFLMNRYYVLAAVFFNLYVFFSPNITDTICTRYSHWEAWSGLVVFMPAHGILQIRIYALYSLNKKILALMLVFYITSSSVSAWILRTDLESLVVAALPILGGKFCVPTKISSFSSFWIPVLLFDFMLFSLAVIRGVGEYRSKGSSIFRGSRSLMNILIRDSVFYFLVIAITYLTCLQFWLSAPLLVEAPLGFAPAMSSVLASRVLFNIRRASREESSTLSQTIQFKTAELGAENPQGEERD
ncbi:hypothetical protein GALMADRAFT_241762 [Galerina marginata CBS 339.88]|uniref:DUF6533 domain-containing protein n=1 Tax=Galerina marginata (strain CBS 339.88) TaxID=685588 RepID=A0A067TMR2_GALM3|nr:hypothetical protein GALMADRAFT_241762 [Galerina marginata CBS 339.88]